MPVYMPKIIIKKLNLATNYLRALPQLQNLLFHPFNHPLPQFLHLLQ